MKQAKIIFLFFATQLQAAEKDDLFAQPSPAEWQAPRMIPKKKFKGGASYSVVEFQNIFIRINPLKNLLTGYATACATDDHKKRTEYQEQIKALAEWINHPLYYECLPEKGAFKAGQNALDFINENNFKELLNF